MKKINKPKLTASGEDVNISTVKSRKRQVLLDAVAARLVNDKEASWSDVGTAFTQALLEKKWDDNLTEAGIREIIGGILAGMSVNQESLVASKIKSSADVSAALKLHRGKRGMK